MNIAQWLLAAGLGLAALPAHAVPVARMVVDAKIVRVQLDCTGPRCLTTGPIRQPYLRGTRPPDLPNREWLRRVPQRPDTRLQQPEMDYRVPRIERDRPLLRNIRPPDPSYRVIAVPPEHRNWCAQRYKSYRAGDNSYQPFTGPRKQCRSPYG